MSKHHVALAFLVQKEGEFYEAKWRFVKQICA
jgi:hypothetical protein